MKITCKFLVAKYKHLYETRAFYQPAEYSFEDSVCNLLPGVQSAYLICDFKVYYGL